MISLYAGTPGSGKSLHSARDIRERLQRKNCISIGNFYVNTKAVPDKQRKGHYIYVDNDRLTPERLRQFSLRLSRHYERRLKEGEILLFIDEAQLLFNTRDFQRKDRKEWLSFFTQHRHMGFDVILVAQFDRMLDRQIRGVIEYEYMHRKISNAGFIGAVLGLLTGGNLFISIKRWYPIHEKVDSEFFLGSNKLYNVYDSYNYFEDNEKIAKGKALDARRGLRGPVAAAKAAPAAVKGQAERDAVGQPLTASGMPDTTSQREATTVASPCPTASDREADYGSRDLSLAGLDSVQGLSPLGASSGYPLNY